MQPYRIEEMARAIYSDVDSTFTWEDLSEPARESYREKARRYAAHLLGGNPVVEVQHGVARSSGTVGFTPPPSARTYRGPQTVIGDDVQVVREKVIYPAAAFVTPWVDKDRADV